jgi:hypothetical protein
MSINLPTKEEQNWAKLSQVLQFQQKQLDFLVNAIEELQNTRAVEVLQWALALVPEQDKHVITHLIVELIKAERAIKNIEEFNAPDEAAPTIDDGIKI